VILGDSRLSDPNAACVDGMYAMSEAQKEMHQGQQRDFLLDLQNPPQQPRRGLCL
jgi:hypothetical protein